MNRAELERGLDEGATRDELERAYYALRSTELGVPEILKQRLSERLRALDVSEGRRSRLMIVGVVLSILFVAVLTGLINKELVSGLHALGGKPWRCIHWDMMLPPPCTTTTAAPSCWRVTKSLRVVSWLPRVLPPIFTTSGGPDTGCSIDE